MRRSLVASVRVALALLFLVLMASRAVSVTITVDGNPSDWGILPGPYGSSGWVPLPGITGSWEDYQPGTAGGYVGPGWGGQTFDAEAIYLTADNAFAYFGIVTGFPPQGAGGYHTGDIALDMGRDGTWDFGIETTGGGGRVAGGLYENIAWGSGLWGAAADPTEILSATARWLPSSTNLFYSSVGNDHYFIETAVPLDKLPRSGQGPTDFRAHWTMSCGNDAVDVAAQLPAAPAPATLIPEPATCTLLGSGLLAILALRSRRKSRAPKSAKS